MILSMTGFGKGDALADNLKITVEVKSLNSKQLDLTMRVPSALRELEPRLRNLAQNILERGKIELALTLAEGEEDSMPTLNMDALAKYRNEIVAASESLGVGQPEDWWPLLLRCPDAFDSGKREFSESDMRLAEQAAAAALNALKDFRIAEGRKLHDFFCAKIAEIYSLLDEIEPMERERVPRIRKRLEEQLSKLQTIEYDEGRLEQELILYIEKLDVTEEKTRLRSHLSYFLETMGSAEGELPEAGRGKKLGFIAQEMGREVNTLGSKSNHAGMQQTVVRMKDAIEQIKEQILNIL